MQRSSRQSKRESPHSDCGGDGGSDGGGDDIDGETALLALIVSDAASITAAARSTSDVAEVDLSGLGGSPLKLQMR